MGCFSMPKGKPNPRYTGDFKQMVVETMHEEHLSCREIAKRFNIPHQRVCSWERIYLTEGPEILHIERLAGAGRDDRQNFPKRLKMICWQKTSGSEQNLHT